QLVGPVPWTLPALRRRWNAAKAEVAPWWAQNSKEAYSSGLDALARALKGFFDSRSGERKGRRVGFPRFHRRGSRRSYRITTGAFGVVDAHHVRLPRIGAVRTKEPTTKLAERLGEGSARILSVTVSEIAGRWYVSFGCRVERPEAEPARTDVVVGVDIGVRSLAVVSTGEVVANPKHASRYARRMARLQRRCSRRQGPGRGRAPSRRWRRSKAALAATHAKVAAARADGLHKLTTSLANTYATVVVEDLNVAGMTASAKGSGRGKAGLNRALLDAAPAELRRQLAYKTAWCGGRLVVADRWYPSSKTCSGCGRRKPSLALAERTWRCECGLVIDRDLNAARNLAGLVEAVAHNPGTGSGPGTGRGVTPANGRGEERFMGSPRCSSANRQDGTSPVLDRTVTAARQREAPEPVLIGSDR
ncbi:MAG: IS607 family element RNA-guided endonuclease TnpB, partial [Acidimicrobiales bacterium]